MYARKIESSFKGANIFHVVRVSVDKNAITTKQLGSITSRCSGKESALLLRSSRRGTQTRQERAAEIEPTKQVANEAIAECVTDVRNTFDFWFLFLNKYGKIECMSF